jgi:hypothetical protein
VIFDAYFWFMGSSLIRPIWRPITVDLYRNINLVIPY